MVSKTTRKFREALAQLPAEIQEKAKDAYRLFVEDPSHRSLRFKKVRKKPPIYSVRITKDYRAVGVLERETIVWFWIGSHAAYTKLLNEM